MGGLGPIRRSRFYAPSSKAQNLIWPANPDYNNPLTAVYAKERSHRFNFMLSEGENTNLLAGVPLAAKKIEPDDVKRVVLFWHKGTANLQGISFFGHNDVPLLQCGEIKDDSSKHEVALAPGERIVGVASHTSGAAFHYDFQLIIAKK